MMAVNERRSTYPAFMTKTQHYRKITKPLLERKRRARMNLYIDELKDLIVETMEAQGEHVAKWEKADILEMTVNYLKMQRHKHIQSEAKQPKETSTNAVNLEKFRAGYTQAAYDVSKIFASLPDLDLNFTTRLMQHLGCRLKDMPKKQQLSKAIAVHNSPNSMMVENAAASSGKAHNHGYVDKHPQHLQRVEPQALQQLKQEVVWRPW